jgi:hypothetical protein
MRTWLTEMLAEGDRQDAGRDYWGFLQSRSMESPILVSLLVRRMSKQEQNIFQRQQTFFDVMFGVEGASKRPGKTGKILQ